MEATHLVETRQAAYLARVVPEHRILRMGWSGGATQIIEAGRGQPLFLLHGGLGEATQWAPLMPALAQRYRVLAVDRPGHGLADAFDHRGADLLTIASRFANEILDALNLRSAVVIGNSMGGLWAAGFALSNPERVSRLILIGAPAGIQRAVPWVLRIGSSSVFSGAMQAGLTRATRDSARAFWAERLVVHPERLGDDFIDLCVASQLRNYPSWISLLQSSINFGGLKPNLLLTDRWKHLQPPTTLIWGEQDRWVPVEAGERIAGAHGFRIVRIPNAGHAPWFDDTAGVARAVEDAMA